MEKLAPESVGAAQLALVGDVIESVCVDERTGGQPLHLWSHIDRSRLAHGHSKQPRLRKGRDVVVPLLRRADVDRRIPQSV
jgi:hypothetical protein